MQRNVLWLYIIIDLGKIGGTIVCIKASVLAIRQENNLLKFLSPLTSSILHIQAARLLKYQLRHAKQPEDQRNKMHCTQLLY